jgi:hypothetical protein
MTNVENTTENAVAIPPSDISTYLAGIDASTDAPEAEVKFGQSEAEVEGTVIPKTVN